ncbi:serine hydrolase domain-containing protein [Candidatus Latescibacterota bacterium]
MLDWDTPLYTYLPYEDIAHDERYKLITARMVVSHTTGFPNWRSGRLEILFTPGSQYGYSGEGFEYLGKVAAHLTGKELVELVQDEVFTPLGMDNAFLTWNGESGGPKARPHLNGDAPLPRQRWDEPRMAASLHVDARTYARFLIAVSQAVGLSEATIEEMLRPQSKVPDSDASFGLGFALEPSPFGLRFGHGGSNDGFTSGSCLYRESGLGYVVLVNNQRVGYLDKALRAFLVTGQVEADTQG